MKPVLRRAFAAASVAWAASLPLSASVASGGMAAPWAYAGAAAVYIIGSAVCHQLPERSFHLGAAQWPVCARCTGIYVGAAIAAMMTASRSAEAPRHILNSPRMARGFSPAKTMLLVSVLPSALTLIYEWSTGDTPSNALRFLAGLPIGAAVAWVVDAVCRDANQVN